MLNDDEKYDNDKIEIAFENTTIGSTSQLHSMKDGYYSQTREETWMSESVADD